MTGLGYERQKMVMRYVWYMEILRKALFQAVYFFSKLVQSWITCLNMDIHNSIMDGHK